MREWSAIVGGPDYSTIRARPVELPRLPSYLPQIRNRAALCGWLDETHYAVRAKEAIGARKSVLKAEILKKRTGLNADQAVILLLFDKDEILERVWTESGRLLPGIATAGYDLVVSPSYSCWTPRPRTEFLLNAKRSLVVYQILQRLGVPAIPRLAWLIEHDVRRAADWLVSNPCVGTIAVDLSTFRHPDDLKQQFDGLRLLDRLTRRRLQYVVNGPTTLERCAELYTLIARHRVTVTDGTLGPPPGEIVHREQLQFAGASLSRGADFRERCRQRREVLRQAGIHSKTARSRSCGNSR